MKLIHAKLTSLSQYIPTAIRHRIMAMNSELYWAIIPVSPSNALISNLHTSPEYINSLRRRLRIEHEIAIPDQIV